MKIPFSNLELFPIAAVTASGNSSSMDLVDYSESLDLLLSVSAPVAGTNPTLDVKLQDSADNSTFADVSGAAFTQVTSAASVQRMTLNPDELKRYVRIVRTIGGTVSPQYLVKVTGIALKKVLS